jgi:hypothetical protein
VNPQFSFPDGKQELDQGVARQVGRIKLDKHAANADIPRPPDDRSSSWIFDANILMG